MNDDALARHLTSIDRLSMRSFLTRKEEESETRLMCQLRALIGCGGVHLNAQSPGKSLTHKIGRY